MIFLLIGARGSLDDILTQIDRIRSTSHNKDIVIVPFLILRGGWFFLIVNLIFHVFLRGVWISAIGLRYISEEINIDSLNYSPKFTRFLKSRVKSFDDYIETLEKICSSFFAFTFLLVFIVLSIGMFLTVNYTRIIIEQWFAHQDLTFLENLTYYLGFLFIIMSIIYMVDFITLGFFKKFNASKYWYYPIYRLISWISLSFLYRSLYYNLIDNKFGRKVGYLIVPYFIFMLIMSSLDIKTDIYLPYRNTSASYLNPAYYENEDDGESYNLRPSIPNKIISKNILEIFIPYNSRQEDKILTHMCKDLKPLQAGGLQLDGVMSLYMFSTEEKPENALACFKDLYRFSLADSLYEVASYFYDHPTRKNKGLLNMMNISHLDIGHYKLKIEQRVVKDDTLAWADRAIIPFWKG